MSYAQHRRVPGFKDSGLFGGGSPRRTGDVASLFSPYATPRPPRALNPGGASTMRGSATDRSFMSTTQSVVKEIQGVDLTQPKNFPLLKQSFVVMKNALQQTMSQTAENSPVHRQQAQLLRMCDNVSELLANLRDNPHTSNVEERRLREAVATRDATIEELKAKLASSSEALQSLAVKARFSKRKNVALQQQVNALGSALQRATGREINVAQIIAEFEEDESNESEFMAYVGKVTTSQLQIASPPSLGGVPVQISIPNLVQFVQSELVETLNVEHAQLFLVDEEKKMLFLHSPGCQPVEVAFGVGIAGHVAETGESLIVNDNVTGHHNFDASVDHTPFGPGNGPETLRTLMSRCCMDVRGRKVAVLTVVNKKRSSLRGESRESSEDSQPSFSEQDAQSLKRLGNQTIIAIANRRLYEAASARTDAGLQTLAQVSAEAASLVGCRVDEGVHRAQSRASLLQKIEDDARELIGRSAVVQLIVVATPRPPPTSSEQLEAWAAQTHTVWLSSDTERSPLPHGGGSAVQKTLMSAQTMSARINNDDGSQCSVLCVPITSHNQHQHGLVYGVMRVERKTVDIEEEEVLASDSVSAKGIAHEGPFSPREVAVCECLAAAAGVVMGVPTGAPFHDNWAVRLFDQVSALLKAKTQRSESESSDTSQLLLLGVRAITKLAEEAFNVEQAVIYTVDEENGLIRRRDITESSNLSSSAEVPLFDIGQGIAGNTALTKRMVNLCEVTDDERFIPGIDGGTKVPTPATLLCAPLVGLQGSMVAVMELVNKRGGTVDNPAVFQQVDEDRMASFAPQAGVFLQMLTVVEHTVSSRACHRWISEFLTLNKINGEMCEVSKTIAKLFKRVTNAYKCNLMWVARSRMEFYILTKKGSKEIRVLIEPTEAAGHVAISGSSVHINDMLQPHDPPLELSAFCRPDGMVMRSVLCMPIRSHRTHEVMAVVQVIHPEPFHFTGETPELMAMMCEQCSTIVSLNQSFVERLDLQDSAIHLSPTHNLPRLVHELLVKGGRIGEADAAGLFFLDPEQHVIWLAHSISGAASDEAEQLDIASLHHGTRFSMSSGLVGHCATTAKCVLVPDLTAHPSFDARVDAMLTLKRGYSCFVPLVSSRVESTPQGLKMLQRKTGVIAVLQLVRKRVGPYTKKHERLISQFAAHASRVLEYCTDHQEVIDNLDLSAQVLDTAITMLGQSNLFELVSQVNTKLPKLLNANRCYFYLPDELPDHYWSVPATLPTSSPPEHHKIVVARGVGLLGAALSGRVISERHAPSHPDFNLEVDAVRQPKIGALLCSPIRGLDGEVHGAIQAIRFTRRMFSRHEINTMQTLEPLLAMAVRNARVQSSLPREISMHTPQHTLDTLMVEIHDMMQQAVRAQAVNIFRLDETKGLLRSCQDTTQASVVYGTGIAGLVAQNGALMNIPDVTSSEHFDRAVDTLEDDLKIRSVLCLLLRNLEGRKIAVVAAVNKLKASGEHDKNGFSEDDERMLQRLGTQAAVAIENRASADLIKNALQSADLHSLALVRSMLLTCVGSVSLEVFVRSVEARVMASLQAESALLYVCFFDKDPTRVGDQKYSDVNRRVVYLGKSGWVQTPLESKSALATVLHKKKTVTTAGLDNSLCTKATTAHAQRLGRDSPVSKVLAVLVGGGETPPADASLYLKSKEVANLTSRVPEEHTSKEALPPYQGVIEVVNKAGPAVFDLDDRVWLQEYASQLAFFLASVLKLQVNQVTDLDLRHKDAVKKA